MPTIETAKLIPDQLSGSVNLQTYCGLDTMVTFEIREALARSAHQVPKIYSFSRALQGPYLEIMQRGFLVDQLARRHAADGLRERREKLIFLLNQMSNAVWNKDLNHRSPVQLKSFFYETMNLPEVWISQKGEKKLSTNREAMEKLEIYLYPRPIISVILTIRDIDKQLEVLENEIDPDGRFRSSYNIAGTESGRPSSSANAFGTGRNAQNISPSLRFAFVADQGKRMCVIDLEQVEARDVGFFCGCIFNDWKFLDSCESGDLHTNNAKLIWPELPWVGEKKEDREIADRNFYREFSYRDMAKRGSHLTNYSGTAWTAARSLKVPLSIMEEFQSRYCRGSNAAYPCLARWWQWTGRQLQTKGWIETPFGRVRHFFGRPDDPTTLREAIAFLPQSTTADRMNLGLWKVWKNVPEIELLAQTYDSITFQYDEKLDEQVLIPKILKLIEIELVSPSGRKYIVPGEAKVGWNWGSAVFNSDITKAKMKGLAPPRLNTEGLVKFKLGTPDARVRKTGLSRIAY